MPRFKGMIADALSGKIDLIITKSVSRFARNTVDSLSTIRRLKENNVAYAFRLISCDVFYQAVNLFHGVLV